MDDTTKPRGLYQQPSGVWKIDKVVRGERIRLSTQTSNLVEAQTVLKRYVSNASRSQKLTAWQALLTAAGFVELEHYYRPAGLPREQQPWLASVWRKPAASSGQ